MSSDESFTRASPPSSIGHGSTQNTRSPSLRAPNTQGVTYLSSQGALSRRNSGTTTSSEVPATPREVESSAVSSAPTQLDPNAQNEAGRKLRKPRSRSPLPPTPVSSVEPINRHNLASSTPPLRTVQSMYDQSPGAYDEDGRLLLDLLVNESPLASPATERTQPHRLPTPEPEPKPEPKPKPEPEPEPGPGPGPQQYVMPSPVRRLPPVPILNVVPPHDSQDAFAYVFGPNHRVSHMEYRGPVAPPPYIARQSAILDRYKVPTPGLPTPPEQKREVVLPSVAPLNTQRKCGK